jgi:hypothetical protein
MMVIVVMMVIIVNHSHDDKYEVDNRVVNCYQNLTSYNTIIITITTITINLNAKN